MPQKGMYDFEQSLPYSARQPYNVEKEMRDLSEKKTRAMLQESRRKSYGGNTPTDSSGGNDLGIKIPEGYVECGHCQGQGFCERGQGKWSCQDCMKESYAFKRTGKTVKCSVCDGVGIAKPQK